MGRPKARCGLTVETDASLFDGTLLSHYPALTATLAVLLHADVFGSTRIVQVDERVAHRSMRASPAIE